MSKSDLASCKRLLPYLVGLTPTVCDPDEIELQELEQKAKIAEKIRREKQVFQFAKYD